jgi:hypothetical protein
LKLNVRNSLRGWVCGVLALAPATAQGLEAAEREFFETRIRPILAENCFKCHGPEKQRSDLRLDHISFLTMGGSRGPVFASQDPDASLMVEAIEYGNVDLQMPPNGKLSEEAISDLREWIRKGAQWPDEPVPEAGPSEDEFNLTAMKEAHWAWQPVAEVEPPAVAHADWTKTPIDQFVLAKLEAAELTPADRADKRTLVRRLYLDLLGLPPTPQQIDSYLNDDRPDAYERLVDTLLASPHFGERWGRHWLDLMRFAETYGHEQDYVIHEAWKYRDYVIRAFNDDLPYTQLIKEHVAGDLLPEPRINPETGLNESIVGTGFWYMHQATHGPVDVAQDLADRIDNQIDVMTKAFLGITVACARCHDHKFDAISTADYYALTGFLRSTRQEFAYRDPNGEIAKGADAIAAIRDQGNDVMRTWLAENAEPVGTEVTQYLTAAHEAMNGTWTEADGPVLLRPDVVYEDFESGSYRQWEVTGKAFGFAPAEGTLENQNEVSGFKGKSLANSFNEGDDAKGKLVSQPFLIERKYIRFLIGGGNHKGQTEFRLRVNDEIVRYERGRNRETLDQRQWDVSEFIGLRGVLEIIDDRTGAWGHINVDHIVFTDSPFLTPLKRPLDTVAQASGVDASRLTRWIHALEDPALNAPNHPMHAWRAASRGETVNEPETDAVLYTDFSDTASWEDAGWFASGEAFGPGPAAPGTWFQNDRPDLVPSKTAHSGAIDRKLQGTLRSPTFTIEHDAIHYRAAGQNARIRLVIGQFQLREFNGLLFEDTLSNVNTNGEYNWTTQVRGIGKFKGQQAYIELIDDGDGFIALDSIWFSDSDKAPSLPNPVTIADASDMRTVSETFGSAARESFAKLAQAEADAGAGVLAAWLLEQNLVDTDKIAAELGPLQQDVAKIADALPQPDRVLAAMDGTPVEAHVFNRGSHKNPGDETPRRFLSAIDDAVLASDKGSARLALAERLVAPDNPLTARVMANRVWHYIFGRGIVPSVDNFGVLGETPTHPELLDYVATRFVESGWSIKSLIRDYVTTETYRMSSARENITAEAKDPANELLHRMRVKRLESEVIRDAILAAAGALNTEMFGESVPAYLSPFNTNHRRPPASGPEDGERRRTIYLEVRRNFLSPMQLAFDFPLPDSTIGSRTRSNVPAQALIMMNDPFVIDTAKAWAQQLITRENDNADARIAYMFERALARPPVEQEMAALRQLLEEQAAEYGLDESAILTDVALWTDMGHTLFTLKEFIFVS